MPQLYQTLPVYHGWDDIEDDDDDPDGGFAMQVEPSDRKGYSGLLEHASVSDGEFLRAWTDTGGFELSRVPHRPSAAVSLRLLNKISIASTIARIPLSNPSKPFTTSSLWNAIDEDSLPVSILESFLRRVCDPTEGTWGGEAGWVISEPRLAACVGRLLLEADHDERKLLPKSSIKATEYLSLPGFLKKWKDAMVEQSVDYDISLEIIKGWYYQPATLTVAWLEPGVPPPIAAATTTETAQSTPAAGAGRGRGKWHAKFAARKSKLGS